MIPGVSSVKAASLEENHQSSIFIGLITTNAEGKSVAIFFMEPNILPISRRGN